MANNFIYSTKYKAQCFELQHISTIPGFYSSQTKHRKCSKEKKKTLPQNDKTVRCKQNYII